MNSREPIPTIKKDGVLKLAERRAERISFSAPFGDSEIKKIPHF
jgi:hypothetical protein